MSQKHVERYFELHEAMERAERRKDKAGEDAALEEMDLIWNRQMTEHDRSVVRRQLKNRG